MKIFNYSTSLRGVPAPEPRPDQVTFGTKDELKLKAQPIMDTFKRNKEDEQT